MKSKEEALAYVKSLAEQQLVTREELIASYNLGLPSGIATGDGIALKKQVGMSEIISYIGGAIVFLGIAISLEQNWSALSFFTKILATLGVSIAAYILGVVLIKKEKTEITGTVFLLVAALVGPIGIGVLLDNMGFDMSTSGSQSVNSGILLIIFLSSYFIFKKNVFTLFSILFGTWFYFAITNFLVFNVGSFEYWSFIEYRLLVLGLAYMLLGHGFLKGEHASLSGFLYGFGVFGFLAAGLGLGNWEPHQNILWEIIYPGLVFGILFVSVYLKNKAFLIWGTIFLMIYILKITSEYFSSNLGWSLALVIAGLAMIGVGYFSVSLKRKYFVT
ncbi:MAG: hypothetical protein JWO40_269 [Candidatus Doudnabacteria bacterium]|nr:hypothetical protein [Candidatus Doudnabacteria bacterium]